MSVRQQVLKPTGQPQYNRVWWLKRASQRAANRAAGQSVRLTLEAPVVAGVALTEKARVPAFVESNL